MSARFRNALLTSLVVVLSSGAMNARAEIYHSKESALKMALPTADTITSQAIVLDAERTQQIESLSRTRLPSRLINVHVGLRDGQIVGYAFLETHTVRSLPETILVAIDPAGHNRGVHLLAFHEPPAYLPPERWLTQFENARLNDDLALRKGIAGIAGSTLTATAITAAVRRLMAIFDVCLRQSLGTMATKSVSP